MSAPFLLHGHRDELTSGSRIHPEVIAQRGYETVPRPTKADDRPRQRLTRLGLPTWSTEEDAYFPGLLVPVYGPTGQWVSVQWKPRRPVLNRDGKPMRYASPKGQGSRLDRAAVDHRGREEGRRPDQ
jgi:hypothetical protein